MRSTTILQVHYSEDINATNMASDCSAACFARENCNVLASATKTNGLVCAAAVVSCSELVNYGIVADAVGAYRNDVVRDLSLLPGALYSITTTDCPIDHHMRTETFCFSVTTFFLPAGRVFIVWLMGYHCGCAPCTHHLTGGDVFFLLLRHRISYSAVYV